MSSGQPDSANKRSLCHPSGGYGHDYHVMANSGQWGELFHGSESEALFYWVTQQSRVIPCFKTGIGPFHHPP